ncbi:MAG: ABC transporter ATP-binding protein [Candidatus Nanopelagicales bacterium]
MSAPSSNIAVSLRNVSKKFGDVVAVDNVNLDVYDKEFLTLLGPSGSGKTTVLRMIAGFELPTSGTIELDGQDVTNLAPFNRNVNTVFQDYALFPHMNVIENISYGLRVKKVEKNEALRLAKEALASVQLAGYEDRKPSQLSGGQRQRVALARALVNRPKVLLLDEPLGALDLKLRQQMQIELKEIQRQVGITFVFVTHDQEEALTMSDRIAVFNNGRIQQIDTPSVIYEHPKNEFVAGFVGTSNLLSKDVAKQILNSDETFTVRPEKITLELGIVKASATQRSATGKVQEVEYLGPSTRFIVKLDAGSSLVVLKQNSTETSEEVSKLRNQIVTLLWEKQSEYRVGS